MIRTGTRTPEPPVTSPAQDAVWVALAANLEAAGFGAELEMAA